MKNVKYLVPIILFLVFIGWQPYVPNLNKNDDNLKGPVKLVVEYIWNLGDINIAVKSYNKYGYVEKIKFYGLSTFDDSIVYGSFPDSVSSLTDTNKLYLLFSNTYKYTESGKLKCYKRVDELKHKLLFRANFYYNEKDCLIAVTEINNYIGDTGDSIVRDSINIHYEVDDSAIIKTVVNNSYDTIMKKIYVLNGQGRIKMIITDDYKHTRCIKAEKYIYDESGKIITMIKNGKAKDDLVDDCFNEIQNFVYNRDGKIFKKEYIKNSRTDSVRHETIFEYDSMGRMKKKFELIYNYNILNLFSEASINQNNDCINWSAVEYLLDKDNVLVKIPTTEKCEYIYDAYGNWITRKRYGNGKLLTVDKRIIQYYKQ